MIYYEIQTKRGAPVFTFDSLERARLYLPNAERRMKGKLAIVQVIVTREERVVQ